MPNAAEIEFANTSQLWLLQAALLEGRAAAEAAENWVAVLREGEGDRLQRLDLASRRLLPLVYRNVKEFIPAQLREKLRLVHHEYWADNQKRFWCLQQLLPWFESNGFPTLVLKGMALAILHYRNMALRPMADLDILVPEDHAAEVIRRLKCEGWTSDYYLASAPKKRYFYRHTHAMPLRHPDYGDLDLHWHVLSDATFRGADQYFWNDSVLLAVNGVRARALNPTDQLLHTCVHGFRANALAPIRWVADAVTILRTAQMDWTRLVGLARELRVTAPLGSSLSFLRATFPTPIPEDVVGEFEAVRLDRAERRYFEKLVHSNVGWREVLAYNRERHRRANRDRNPILAIPSLAQQLQLHYNLPQLKDLGIFAFSKIGKRILKGLGCS